jgi:ribosomal protein S18 acetylase RimI-like enzyme
MSSNSTTFPAKSLWPWRPQPRVAGLVIEGDVQEVVAFGIGRTLEELRWVTAMITSGFPDGPVKATWSLGADKKACVAATHQHGDFAQKFVRDEDGHLQAEMDALVLDPAYHKGGHAKRLIRNLVIVLDALGVTCASTIANYGNGGYTWAVLGACAKDPETQRGLLKERVAVCVRARTIPAAIQDYIVGVIDRANDHELMHAVAELELNSDHDVGKEILLPHSWNAMWDLSNQTQRDFILEALR